MAGNEVYIQGMSAVTPLGSNIGEIAEAIKAGKTSIKTPSKILAGHAEKAKDTNKRNNRILSNATTSEFDKDILVTYLAETKEFFYGFATDDKAKGKIDRSFDKIFNSIDTREGDNITSNIAGLYAFTQLFDKRNSDWSNVERNLDVLKNRIPISFIVGTSYPNNENINFLNSLDENKGIMDITMQQPELLGLLSSANTHNPGGSFSASAACASSLYALREAWVNLSNPLTKESEAIVYGLSEGAGGSPYLSFTRITALSNLGICRPYDKDRDGFILSDGSSAMHLSREGKGSLGKVLSCAINSDGDGSGSLVGVMDSAEGFIKCIYDALEIANLKPEDIDIFIPHGTSTHDNDRQDFMAYNSVFGNVKKGHKPIISALKGYFGHTVGGSGLNETNLSIACTSLGFVPKCLGTKNIGNLGEGSTDFIDFPLPIDDHYDLSYMSDISKKPYLINMKSSAGFGGHNAVAIIASKNPLYRP